MAGLAAWRQEPHWSYSSINALLNICSLQWAMRKVYRVPPAFTPVNLAFGKAFHRACEAWSRSRMLGSDTTVDDVQEAFSAFWAVEQESASPPIRWDEAAQPAALEAKGRQMLAALIAGTPPTDRVVGVSVPFRVHLVGALGEPISLSLIGEIDCVVETPNGTVLVDWKTAASRWPVDKGHRDLQPTVYLYAWACMYPNHPATFRYDVVTKAKTPVVEQHSTLRVRDDFNRLATLVRGLDRLVDQGVYLPRPESFACSGCQYAAPCAEWHRAAA